LNTTRPLDGKRILFVDDDADIRKMFHFALEAAGATVFEAATVSEVRARLAEARVDALILDWHLADDSPEALLRSLDAHQPGLARRTVVVSGDPRIIGRGVNKLSSGVYTLGKPFRPRDLIDAIARLIEASPAE
jgi:two-component system OmpR family response regulator